MFTRFRQRFHRTGKRSIFAIMVCLCVVFSSSCHKSKHVLLTVSVAASLTGTIESVEHAYTQQHPEIEFRNNFGSSGSLARQIEQGAPVDLFLSAGAKPVDELKAKGLVDAGQYRILLRNRLVLIAPSDSKLASVSQLGSKEVNKIALGEPASVPAGQYTMQSLQTLKLFSPLQSKFVYAKDVRQVLAYVESGNVDAGFVYATDALSSQKVKVIETLPEALHDPIVYPIVVIAQSAHAAESRQFIHALFSSTDAAVLFTHKGFIVANHE